MRRTPFAMTLLAAALLVTACSTGRPFRTDTAVVIHQQDADRAEEVRRLLADEGATVVIEEAGPAERTRTSVAVYDLVRDPQRLERVQNTLAPLGELEFLPFAQPGPGGTTVVVWLVGE